jgi:osmotically-inducible protein OsmY
MKKTLHTSTLALLFTAASAFTLAGCATGGGAPVDDATLKERVESYLKNDSEFESHPIKVRVENGVVTLTGLVLTRTEWQKAEQDARMVGGVKDVVNKITLNDIMKMQQ